MQSLGITYAFDCGGNVFPKIEKSYIYVKIIVETILSKETCSQKDTIVNISK